MLETVVDGEIKLGSGRSGKRQRMMEKWVRRERWEICSGQRTKEKDDVEVCRKGKMEGSG